MSIAQAVSRNAGSSPRVLRTMFWRKPISDMSARITVTISAIAITPNISGTSSRVMTRLLPRRSACPSP